MRLRRIALTLAAAVLFPVASSYAATITLTGSQINNFAYAPGLSTNVINASNNLNGFFDVDFDSNNAVFSEGVFELTGLGIGYAGGDVFGLIFTSNDLSTWGYELVVQTDGGNFTTGVVNITGGATTLLSVALAAGTTITGIQQLVSGVIPNTNNSTSFPDVAVDYRVESIPEPATLLLMGSGLVALGLLRRRNR